MKKKILMTIGISSGLPLVVFAGGIKGDLISDEALIIIFLSLLLIMIGSISTAIAYYRSYRTVYLIISAMLTLPFFMAGIYLMSFADNLPLLPVLCFLPVLCNTLLFITAKQKKVDQA